MKRLIIKLKLEINDLFGGVLLTIILLIFLIFGHESTYASTDNLKSARLPMLESVSGLDSIAGISEGKGFLAVKGQWISFGSTLKTNENNSAVLIYPDGSHIEIFPSTQFTVEAITEGTQWNKLAYGAVRGTINKLPVTARGVGTFNGRPKFLIRTKTAVLGVRGTDFVMTLAASGESQVHTLEGIVDVGKNELTVMSGKGTPVSEGEYIQANSGGISSIQSFNKSEYLNKLNTDKLDQVKKVEKSATENANSGQNSLSHSLSIPEPTHFPNLTLPQKGVPSLGASPGSSLNHLSKEPVAPIESHLVLKKEEPKASRFKLLALQAAIFFARLPDHYDVRAANLAWTPIVPVPYLDFLTIRGNLGGSFALNGSLNNHFWLLEYQAFLTLSVQDFMFFEVGYGRQIWKSLRSFNSGLASVNAGLILGFGPIDRVFIGANRMFNSPWFDEYKAGIQLAF